MTEFKSVKELVGKLARRAAPNIVGDYSFITEPVLIREVTEFKIFVTTTYGHKIELSYDEYDDRMWVESSRGITSSTVADLYGEILMLQRELYEERRKEEDSKNGRS